MLCRLHKDPQYRTPLDMISSWFQQNNRPICITTLAYMTGLFVLLLTVGCADYSLPDDAYLLDDGRHDDNGDVITLRLACIHDNATSWQVTCREGMWMTLPEGVVVDCTHARSTAVRDASSAVRVAANTSSTNQGSCLLCLDTSLADIISYPRRWLSLWRG